MLEWLKRPRPNEPGLEAITRKFEQMLEDGRHTFDLAAVVLLGEGNPEVIRNDLFLTDQRINRTEQEIRRQLVVHGSVHGSLDIAELLVMMSLVKDAERIGDYSKNLFDLAVRKPSLLGEDERERLVDLKDRIGRLLVRARNLFEDQDERAARKFLADADVIEDECDAAVHRMLAVEGRNAAGPVLAYRYFKRICSHASNVVSSLVMPVDKLDFFDEPEI